MCSQPAHWLDVPLAGTGGQSFTLVLVVLEQLKRQLHANVWHSFGLIISSFPSFISNFIPRLQFAIWLAWLQRHCIWFGADALQKNEDRILHCFTSRGPAHFSVHFLNFSAIRKSGQQGICLQCWCIKPACAKNVCRPKWSSHAWQGNHDVAGCSQRISCWLSFAEQEQKMRRKQSPFNWSPHGIC